jgi:hypothetical protein
LKEQSFWLAVGKIRVIPDVEELQRSLCYWTGSCKISVMPVSNSATQMSDISEQLFDILAAPITSLQLCVE